MSKERAAHDSNNGRDQSTFEADMSKRKPNNLNRATNEQVLHQPTDHRPENVSDARVKSSNSREKLFSRREEVPPNSNNRSLDFIRDGHFPPSEGAFQGGSYDHRGTTFDHPIEETSQSYFDIARLQTEPIQLPPPKAVFLEHRHRANTMPSTFKNEGLFQEPDFPEEYTRLPNRHGIEAQHAEVAQDSRHSLYKRFPSDDGNIWERFDKLQMEDIGSQRLKERSSYLDESNILYNSKSPKDLHFKQDYLNGHTGLASVFDSNFNPQGGPYSYRNPRIQKETNRFPTTLSTTSPGLDISSFTAVSHQLAAAEDINPTSWAPFVTTARVEGRPIRAKMNSYDNLGSIPSPARNQNFFTPDLFDVIGDGYPVMIGHDSRHQYFKQSGEMRKPPAYSHEVEANHLVPKLVPSGNYHENHYKPNGTGDFGSGNPVINNHQNGYHHPKTNTAKNSKPSSNKNNHKKPANDAELMNRFQGVSLESLVGEIHGLCRDQYGCRYLQKKLEEQNPVYTDFIFEEVNGYFVDLMTDPFGNYLCQKLLEYTRDEQRTVLVGKVAPELVNISLNMHGTRAAQKLIEYLSNAQQIQLVIVALTPSVVPLIKDLNGNHVIQKCLNSMSAENNQFIYDAVCRHCIEVASHRHGCCVFQRCIDYASPAQKAQLIGEITVNGLKLVQDPFGNYVVQYVLDLGEGHFSNSLIRTFWGSVCVLSIQKFSSNVIEKCIRVADHETRKGLIEELLNPEQLEKMLRDSFANYVVQTALDYADPVQRSLLVECIKPMIPFIKNTPYGKRIQGKLLREQAHPNAFPPPATAPMANVGYKGMRPEYKHTSMNAMGVNNHRFPFY